MARSRRGGGSRSGGGGGLFGAKRKPAPPAPARRAPPPPASAQSRPPAPMQSQAPAQSGGMLSGIGSTIAQGMAFGTGSAIAHRAVGAVAGSMSGGDGEQPQQMEAAPAQQMDQQQQQMQGPCAYDKEMFFDCLKQNKGDQESCSFLYQQLQSCQRNETTFG